MLKQLRPAIISSIIMLIIFGVIYPFIITGIARVAFPHQANGSLIQKDGKIVGSELIGQDFTSPEYFHPRPSAAGDGYDASNSGGTNLGPTSDKLINGIHNKLPDGTDDPGNFDGIKDLAAAYRKENNLGPDAEIPADAVTRSASGLDPDISVKNAMLQAGRVAGARKVPEASIISAIKAQTEGRVFGILGEPRVNVLELNLALDLQFPIAK